MDINENLTNEKISRKFDNQFDLVNYAIRLTAEMIMSGRASRVDLDTENPALHILEEISEGKDRLEVTKDKRPLHQSMENYLAVETVTDEPVPEKAIAP